MSIQLIQQYYSNVERLIRYGGTRNESSLRKAFQELLDHYARSKNLVLVQGSGTRCVGQILQNTFDFVFLPCIPNGNTKSC